MLIEIRTAAISDAVAICDVVRRSISECCVADHQNDHVALSAWLYNKTPENASTWVQSADAIAVVAVRNNSIFGFALSSGDELALCYVAPEALYQGVGKALLHTIETHSLSQGVRVLRLESTRTAQEFYARNGFTISGPTQVWAGMEGLPMVKHLMANPSVKGTSCGLPQDVPYIEC